MAGIDDPRIMIIKDTVVTGNPLRGNFRIVSGLQMDQLFAITGLHPYPDTMGHMWGNPPAGRVVYGKELGSGNRLVISFAGTDAEAGTAIQLLLGRRACTETEWGGWIGLNSDAMMADLSPLEQATLNARLTMEVNRIRARRENEDAAAIRHLHRALVEHLEATTGLVLGVSEADFDYDSRIALDTTMGLRPDWNSDTCRHHMPPFDL